MEVPEILLLQEGGVPEGGGVGIMTGSILLNAFATLQVLPEKV